MRNYERERELLAMLERQGTLSVMELAVALRVSDATIRRDLQAMESRGMLRRLHGGATLEGGVDPRREPLFADKDEQHNEEKLAIARRALELIHDGDSVYLDGGSTVLRLVRLLGKRHNLTLVTNSLVAAVHLLDTQHRLILIGGEFRSISRTVVGPLTADTVSALHVDLAFMGTMGFCPKHGMTTTDPNEAFTKEQMMRRADKVVLLADSSKLGVRSLARSGTATDVNILITNSVTPAFQEQLAQNGTELILAPPTDPKETR